MVLTTPQFWKSRQFISYLLVPLSWVYRLLSQIRLHLIAPYKPSFINICIGNITVGGAGKTPVALAIGQLLEELNVPYSYLSKGYGGTIDAPTPVDHNKHTAHDVGDEPLLLAAQAPTIVSKSWKVGAEAIGSYASTIIMDDGLQNPSIKKDLSLLVINGAYGIGNGFTFPAGPLRESLDSALKRVDAVILIGDDIHHLSDQIHLPIINATIEPECPKSLKGKKVIAFAGIADTEKFFVSAKSCGYEVIDTHSFPDHHPYTKSELDALVLQAKRQRAVLLTTEKDFVRLPKSYHHAIETLPIHIKWAYKKEIINLLQSKVTTTS